MKQEAGGVRSMAQEAAVGSGMQEAGVRSRVQGSERMSSSGMERVILAMKSCREQEQDARGRCKEWEVGCNEGSM